MPRKLTPGGDVRSDWRTTNQVIDQQDAHRRLLSRLGNEPRQIYGGGNGRLQTYRVKSKLGDVLTCRTWDGTTEGDTDVLVAVNRNSRQLDSETINSITYTYTAYTDVGDGINETRNANDGTDNETQIVTPMWTADGEIDVLRTNYSGVLDGDSADIKLIEVSARCWARVSDPAP